MTLRPWMSVPALSVTLGLPPAAAEPPRSLPPVAPQPMSLSAESLQTLVAGVALCPDPVIELLLDAAQHPQALHRVASAGALPGRDTLPLTANDEDLPLAVQRLRDRHGEILAELDRNLVITGLLGRMYEQQPKQVWAAIRAVQRQIGQLAATAPQSADVNGHPAAATVWAADRVAQRLAVPAVLAELQRYIGPGAPNPLEDKALAVRSPAAGVAQATNAVSHSRPSSIRTTPAVPGSLAPIGGADVELRPALQHLQLQFSALHRELNRSAGTTARTLPPTDSSPANPGGRTIPRPVRRSVP